MNFTTDLMDIQNIEHKDVKCIADILPFGWEDVIPIIDSYTKSKNCFPVKVSIDKKIVGIGTTIIHNETAWLAHIIVHADYRKQSIGTEITRTLIDTAYSKGSETIYLLATDLGEPVYRKIGFENEAEYIIFKCEVMNKTIKNSDNIVAIKNDFKKQVLDLDRKVTGEDRTLIIEEHLSDGFLYLQENKVQGFYLPNLGHGLIIANTITAGQVLMKLRLRSKDFAAFPIENFTQVNL